MTTEALYNLQRGVPENKIYPATNYTIETALDRYVLSRCEMLEKINQKELREAEKKITDDIICLLEKELFKGLK